MRVLRRPYGEYMIPPSRPAVPNKKATSREAAFHSVDQQSRFRDYCCFLFPLTIAEFKAVDPAVGEHAASPLTLVWARTLTGTLQMAAATETGT